MPQKLPPWGRWAADRRLRGGQTGAFLSPSVSAARCHLPQRGSYLR